MAREDQQFLNYNLYPNEWAWDKPLYPETIKDLKQYEGNKHFGDWWRYHNYELIYNHNDYGYRGVVDFKDLDWSKTVAIYGCSYVYGQGVSEHETISHYLQAKLNTPVVNMGVPGSGIEAQYWNIRWLNKKFKPKWNIVFWPYDDRIVIHQGIDDNNNGFGTPNAPPRSKPKAFKPHWQTNMWLGQPHLFRAYGLTPNYLVSEDFRIRMNRFKIVTKEDFPNLTEYSIHDKMFKKEVDPILGKIQNKCGMGTNLSLKAIQKNFYDLVNSDKEIQKFINRTYAKDVQVASPLGSGVAGHWGPKFNSGVAQVLCNDLEKNPKFT